MSLIQILNGAFQDTSGAPLASGTLVFTLSHDEQEPSIPETGTVGTNGTTVTWLTGDQFSNAFIGVTITINGTPYVVQTVISNMTLVLTTSAGTQTGPYSANIGPGGQVVSGLKVTVILDANGNVPASPVSELWANSELTPAGSYYTLVGYNASSQQVYGPQYILIPDTNPYDLGNISHVYRVVFFYWVGGGGGGGGGGTSIALETNGALNASQTVLNLVDSGSVTFTNPSGGNVTATSTGSTVELQTNGVDNTSQTLLNLVQGTNVTLLNSGGAVTISATGGGGGGVSGSGTAGTIPIWTSSTVLGNSLLLDNGSTLTYTGFTFQLNGGEITTPDAASGPADIVLAAGNATGGGASKAANIVLDPGVQSTPSLTNNGRVSVRPGCAFYFGSTSFSQLAVPRGNPSSPVAAIVYCTDAKGTQDSVASGSIAVGSGTGAILKYNGSNWLVVA